MVLLLAFSWHRGLKDVSCRVQSGSIGTDGPGWLPAAANFITLGCFALGVELNLYFAQVGLHLNSR